MKISACATFVSILVATAASFAQAPDLQHMDLVLRSVPDGPIAKVNGVNIPREEFVRMYQSEVLGIIARTHSTDVPDQTRIAAAVSTMRLVVQHELLSQEAAKRNISVSEEELNTQWSETLEDMKKSFSRSNGSASSLSEAEILKQAGVTKEEALQDLRKGVLVRKMRDKIASGAKVTVTDAEVSKFFSDNKDKFKHPQGFHLQQIYIKTRAGKTPFDEKKMADAHQRAENAHKRLQAGDAFETVAKAVSDSPDKDNGGDMGMLPATKLPPFFTEPASKMKPGEISDIIQSDLGLHIFKLVESVPGEDATLDKVGPVIRKMLLENKAEQSVMNFCKPILDDPKKVEIYLQLNKNMLDKTIAESAPQSGKSQENNAVAKPQTAETNKAKSAKSADAPKEKTAGSSKSKSASSSKKTKSSKSSSKK
jgi:parvulin-like peptidyl-prolyl isomerase